MSISTGSVDHLGAAQPGHMAAHDRVLAEVEEYEYVRDTYQRERQGMRVLLTSGCAQL